MDARTYTRTHVRTHGVDLITVMIVDYMKDISSFKELCAKNSRTCSEDTELIGNAQRSAPGTVKWNTPR